MSKNLNINTDIGYFSMDSFLKIIDLIECYNFKTIFIDDINYYMKSDSDCYFGQELKEEVLRAFRFIVDRYAVNIIFTIKI